MIKYFMKKFRISESGAKNLMKGGINSAVLDIIKIAPVIMAFMFLDEFLNPFLSTGVMPTGSIQKYVVVGIGICIVFYFVALKAYNSTYVAIYSESKNTRINLAETLRKLPLSFFAKRDVADLAATIMSDVTIIEQLFSHNMPQLIGSIISTALFVIMMLVYNFKLTLSLIVVVPIAILCFALALNWMKRGSKELTNIQISIHNEVQECLDGVYEIKAYNREEDFSKKVDKKLDKYEKRLGQLELWGGCIVNASSVILKLALITVTFVGIHLVAQGEATLFELIVYIIIAGRIFDSILLPAAKRRCSAPGSCAAPLRQAPSVPRRPSGCCPQFPPDPKGAESLFPKRTSHCRIRRGSPTPLRQETGRKYRRGQPPAHMEN